MKKIFFLTIVFILVALMLVACNESTSLQQSFDEHQQFIEFVGHNGATYYAFYYDASLFPSNLSIVVTQNGESSTAHAYAEFLFYLYGGNERSNYIVPNSYVYFSIPPKDTLFGVTTYFNQGIITINVYANDDTLVASHDVYYIPPSPSA